MTEDLLEQLKVALADHYAIESELGEGGMAYVFLAQDIKHDRMVAVKVLKPDLASNIGTERFLREIKNAAKLSHPHILPVYDSGAANRFLYYVMPFIEGESLSDYIEREKQLAIDEAVKIAREVAEALSVAHSYGLVHRDIKPENIMMTGGHAVVADFGIALAVDQSGGEKLTQTGMTMGTPAYMSPEQAAGDPNLDGRTDIYSLGCVLYEMLIGQIPFTAPTPQAMIARHTMDHITPPHIMRDTIPPDLEDIVYQAMSKTPADRFRTAQEFAEALAAVEQGAAPKVRRTTVAARQTMGMYTAPPSHKTRNIVIAAAAVVVLAGGTFAALQLGGGRSSGAGGVVGGLDPKNVAVLYFDDLSPDKSLGYLADGFTEGLITQLSTVRALNVVSRNGVSPFRDSQVSRDSIARALDAGSLIVGTVEPEGDDLLVNIRLVEGTSGADFERTSVRLSASRLLEAQDSVVQEVSRILRGRLGEEIRTRELRASTASVDAWALVQRAERMRKEAETSYEGGDIEAAVATLLQADSVLEIAEADDRTWVEPTLRRGWLADRIGRMRGGNEAVPWFEQGLAHAERVLETAPADPAALALRGTVRYHYWELRVTPDQEEWQALLDSAEEDLQAAVEADPTLAEAYITLSFLYYQIDDVPGALMAARRGYEEDAYLDQADVVLNRLFWGSIDLEQFAQARRWCAEAARRFSEAPAFVECQLWLIAAGATSADVEGAWTLYRRLDSLSSGPRKGFRMARGRMLVAGALARSGLADSARSMLLTARRSVTAEDDPTQVLLSVEAYIRSVLGDYDEAIDLLKRYVAANPDHDFPTTASTAWWWRDLRSQPRFREITGS